MGLHRIKRLNEQLKTIIATTIAHSVKDPQLGMVTVTRVDISGDYRIARVYVSYIGTPQERQAQLKILKRAASFIQMELSHQIRLRLTPKLDFILDENLEYAINIQKLLDGIHHEPENDDEPEE